MGIRLVVIDDNPHLAWGGAIYPANATFEHFVAAILDIPGSPVASISAAVPLRAAVREPETRPLDPRIHVIGTAPFDGIDGYLRHLPAMIRSNGPILRRAIAETDLIWIKVPASNAALAGTLAAHAGVPRFIWVAGSAADVAAARFRGPGAIAARAIGTAYDLIGRSVAIGGDRVVVGREFIASLVEPSELRDDSEPRWPEVGDVDSIRLVWAGRVAAGKGIETILEQLAARPPDARPLLTLTILGDGPDRHMLEDSARNAGLAGHVRWAGHVAERARYLEMLRDADVFVFPSLAEGFPKVVLDAMAVGLPVLAQPVGGLRALVDRGVLAYLGSGPGSLDRALAKVLVDARTMRSRADLFVRDHTRPRELARLVDHWRQRWSGLPW